ncbi:RagB/SusD family nutrient uptake outer membrane protein [Flavobacteriaceae bacterium]|nr:RagB/SusD family nutrient uptake outer membrane protein [Flavobacteriaceae bacterium]
MKNYKLKLILVLSTCFVLSCDNDFIELTSISEASSDDFYKTSNDFENALIASYDALQSNDLYGQAFDRLVAIRADDAVDDNSSSSTRASDVDKFQESATNGFVNNAWRGTYIGISRANIVISRIDQADFDSSTKSKLKAEAQFIRALLYFNAVRIWGAIPLILDEQTVLEVNQKIQDKTLIRNSIADVYATIVEDLKFAEQNLPVSNSVGRATSYAAKAILGRVYLTLGNHSAAEAKLNEVIVGENYQLLPNIADVFDVDNKGNDELIFVVAYDKNISGEGHAAWYSNNNFEIVSQSLKDKYNPIDRRLPLLETSAGTTGIIPNKFFDTEFQAQVGNDFPVIRFADVLLMRAEALNEIGYVPDGDAFSSLNQVRTRAGLTVYTATDLTNQEEFRDAVLFERELEFPLEHIRWPDLVRTGRAISVMAEVGLTITSNNLLFPVPQSEIEIINNSTGFVQNPGY